MIDFEHIYKSYNEGETVVFSDFSLSIERGEFVVLTGVSGSGKSTLISMLLLDKRPDSGDIYVNERRLASMKGRDVPKYRQSIGAIFQDFRLMPDETVYGNIEIARIISGAPQKNFSQRVYHVSKMLGITNLLKKHPDEISGGEMQKVCIARAIVNNPQIFIADEPTSNLDTGYSKEILKLLALINKQGITLLIATQDPVIASYEGARIVELEKTETKTDIEGLCNYDDEKDWIYDVFPIKKTGGRLLF